ncbi:MAG: helix-turn-helix domain-containing protein, partial [Candidatus Acidiferrales bacterium]
MNLTRVNVIAGRQLRAWREKVGLSTRAVTAMSREIASKHQNEEFFLSHNWVTDIENGRFMP